MAEKASGTHFGGGIEAREPGPEDSVMPIGELILLISSWRGAENPDVSTGQLWKEAMDKVFQFLDWIEAQQRRGRPFGIWMGEAIKIMQGDLPDGLEMGEAFFRLEDALVVFPRDLQSEVIEFLNRLEPLIKGQLHFPERRT